jgi:hypothetical protein
MSKEQIEKSFRVAESFQRCGHILSYYVNHDPSLTAQWIINTALSIEIYFKCLYLIENGKELRGHHLLELFQSLSVSSRNAIKTIYTNEFVASPSKKHWDWFVNQGAPIPDFTQIAEALEHANSAFVSWRYSIECD